jgi:circadian clock protein KaiC
MTDPVSKAPTGIAGFDEITAGGLPKGRPTLLVGPAGGGKTLFGVEFLTLGGAQAGEAGVFVTFEESAAELAADVASLGIDLDALQADGRIAIEHIRLNRQQAEVGAYDLEALMIRISAAVQRTGARRLVVDTLDVLFGSLRDEAVVRAELARLFDWTKEAGITTVVTAERGAGSGLTRIGVEEYVSDCVVVLDQRVEGGIATRRIRVAKYRGSQHGTNEYPFHIGARGISVQPITSVGLDSAAPTDRVSTGVEEIDVLLDGGVYRATSILITGTPGTGKSTIAASFVAAACLRGERALYVAHEESAAQIVRNMASVGIDLAPLVASGHLEFLAVRPTIYGTELHYEALRERVTDLDPAVVVVDPISSLVRAGSRVDVLTSLIRQIDFLKQREITAVYTAQTTGETDQTDLEVSSLIDTWLELRNVEVDGERNRLLYLTKSRGTAHSNQVREFLLTDHGIALVPPYIGGGEVYTGSARVNLEARERAEVEQRRVERERRRRSLERRRAEIEAQIAAMWAAFDAETADEFHEIDDEEAIELQRLADRDAMLLRRGGSS